MARISGIALMLVGRAALACPQCVQADGSGNGKYFLLASMILLPFGVAGAAIHFIRQADQGDSKS